MKGLQAIDEKLKQLQDFQQNAGKYAIDALMSYDYVVLDMNFEEQLYMLGVNADNIPIMRYEPYSPATIFIKNQKQQPSDRVTLKDTGDFYSGAKLDRIDDLTAEITSDDIKTSDLVDRYGKEIFGLIADNMIELRKHYIFPDLKKILNGN